MANKSAKALFSELDIDPNRYSATSIKVIRKWCMDNISRDINYLEDNTESFNKYVCLVKDFLNNFLANLPAEPEQKVAAFQDQNPIQYAAYNGYDVYLASLNCAKLTWSAPNSKSLTPLHLAAIHGQVNTTKVLLEKGADPMQINKNQQTPIFTALLMPALHADSLVARKQEVFKLLAASCPDALEEHDRSGDTIFHLLVANGNIELFTSLLQKNPRIIDYANNHCHFLIHTAILNKQLEIAKQLLELDGVAEQTDAMLRTPLHYAARYGTAEMLNLCLNSTKNTSALDMENKTPLTLAKEANNYATTQILQNICS